MAHWLIPMDCWFLLLSALQQQSPRSFNCGPLCIAAAYHAAKLTPFPLALPEKTVCRAKQQNILIEIHCTCGRPDTFDDMVACDGCDHWFHLSCVNMEDVLYRLCTGEQWINIIITLVGICSLLLHASVIIHDYCYYEKKCRGVILSWGESFSP